MHYKREEAEVILYPVIVLEWHVFACAQLNSQSNQNKHTIYEHFLHVFMKS